MTLPAAFLDELRARTRLSALIARDVKLQRAGSEMKGCCPFHQEKTPSFYVNDAKGFYHCFGCSAHGDVIRWMTDYKAVPFLDAVRELADQAGLEMPAHQARDDGEQRHRNRLYEIMARAERFYAERLEASADARLFLGCRDIDETNIRQFAIGFAPGAAKGAPSPIAGALRDVDPALLVELGLLKRAEDGDRLYDFFRNRVMIPIHDARGRTIAFGARAVGDAQPKYLNSPDTSLFDKGRTLFNLHRAAGAARRKGRVIVVEGYFDVLALARAGIEEAVAPNGTAITEAQLDVLWRLSENVLICLDGDAAGRKAAVRAARLALPHLAPGKALRFVFPPAGLDPDDLERQKGARAVSALFDSPRSLPSILWEQALAEHGAARDADSRAALVQALEEHVKSIRNERIALEYWEEWRGLLRGAQKRAARAAPSGNKRSGIASSVEDAVLAGLLRHPALIPGNLELLSALKWTDSDAEAVASRLIDAAIAGNLPDQLWQALEHANLAGIARMIAARTTLAFKFLTAGPDDSTSQELLAVLERMPAR
ncbi:MAG: DNA primase [Sphingomonas sp.]|nr:DNA primase [Sphingomonas sp.]